MESTPQNTPYHIAFTGASQGHADAQFNLGCCYATGEGVAKDQAEAVRWYNMAAKQGHADAQFNLTSYYARCYENSEGVAKDQAAAIEWFLKAALQNDPKAQSNLGHILGVDSPASPDRKEALKWLLIAKDNGEITAIKTYKELMTSFPPALLAIAQKEANKFLLSVRAKSSKAAGAQEDKQPANDTNTRE
jgi:TPR repeat protein